MPTTPNLLLPYPVATDTADVPRDMKALADRLDIVAGAPAAIALPGSPVDGQETYIVADANNGVMWHFRYRAASPSALKWEFVGGAPIYSRVPDTDTTTSGSYVALAHPGPGLILPLAGDYMITLCAQIIPAANDGATASVKLGTAAMTDDEAILVSTTGAGVTGNMTPSRTMRRNGLAAGALLTTMYKSALGTGVATFTRRELSIYPVRVG